MTRRSVLAVLVLAFVTFGIYGFVWFVKTKNEMNARGADIPTAWLAIIPIVNLYWLFKYAEGVEHVTGRRLSTGITLILLWFLGVIGMAVIQDQFNRTSLSPEAELAFD